MPLLLVAVTHGYRLEKDCLRAIDFSPGANSADAVLIQSEKHELDGLDDMLTKPNVNLELPLGRMVRAATTVPNPLGRISAREIVTKTPISLCRIAPDQLCLTFADKVADRKPISGYQTGLGCR